MSQALPHHEPAVDEPVDHPGHTAAGQGRLGGQVGHPQQARRGARQAQQTSNSTDDSPKPAQLGRAAGRQPGERLGEQAHDRQPLVLEAGAREPLGHLGTGALAASAGSACWTSSVAVGCRSPAIVPELDIGNVEQAMFASADIADLPADLPTGTTRWKGQTPTMTTTPETARDIAVEQATENAAGAVRVVDGVALPAAGTYVLDPTHTRVGFVARHLMVTKVRGSFTPVRGLDHRRRRRDGLRRGGDHPDRVDRHRHPGP